MFLTRLWSLIFGECRVRGHDCREGVCVRCGLGMDETIRACLRGGDYFVLPAYPYDNTGAMGQGEECIVDPINVECPILPWEVKEALQVWNEHGFFNILVEQGYRIHGYRMVHWDTESYGHRELQTFRFCALGEAGLEKLRDVLTRLEQHKVRAALHHCQGNKIGLRFETPTEQWTIEVFQGGRGRTECEPVDATGQHIASPLQQTLWSWAAADSSGRKQDTPHVGEDPVDPSVASGDGVPPCPKCQSKDARCFCRDVGGVGYLDEYTFSCPACGYLKRETEYGGSWADNWTTRCPFCGETCHRHKATPSDFWFAAETGMRTSDEE